MKIVQLNVTCAAGSTGKICLAVSELLTEKGVENYILYSEGQSDYPLGIKYADDFGRRLQALKSRFLGNYGFNSKAITKALLRELDRIGPDIVHLHNLHGHGCNLTLLFNYFKEKNIRLYWTFHDCWAFTGYCPHFDMAGCDRWLTKCESCPQRAAYSLFFDRSEELYNKKKELFTGLDLTIITPSQWLADLVKKSFLGSYEVRVINNGIDLEVFTERHSNFRQRYATEGEFLILGVAFNWDDRKGLDVFRALAGTLPKDCRIVLVGTNEAVRQSLPENIIAIDRTANQQELSEIYSATDIFVNATREDTFPTVNIEALACGTPVVTFDTGGSGEIINETCGIKVPKNDVEALIKAILHIKESRPFTKESCRKRAEDFRAEDKFREYIESYNL